MQNLLNELTELLLKDERIRADGKLLKNKVVELALGMDSGLIKLLLGTENIKTHFFTNVDGVFVFDKIKFQRFISNKDFLPDSYTAYKNNTGLVNENGNYLSESKEIVLAWPYKDCILEGGQTKDDQKRNEIFWNETLAPDEIDRLLAPKVFTNFKQYDKKGEHTLTEKSEVDFSQQNFIIRGNNLLALHSLYKRYAGKIKLIYIDPPYNRDGENGFGYNDRFNHSTWYTFIKNRLDAAKFLMRVDGLIFIHIGDQELHYLKVLADSIFGRENFVATVPRKARSGKTDVPYKLSQDFDWILIYTKGASKKEELFQRSVSRKYYKTDDFPGDEWRLSDLTKQTSIKERPKSNFTLINPRNGEKFPVNPNRAWAITVDTVPDYLKRKKIVFPGDYDFQNIEVPAMRVFKSEEIEKKGEDFDKTYVSSDFLNKAMDDLLKNTANKKGTEEIIELFGNKAFPYPKNELLIQRIIEYASKEDDIILDFFLGSGTTAAVAHKLNRRYIGIEQMDYIVPVTVERMKKVINGEQGGISTSINWDGGGSFIYCELMEWNETLITRIQKAKDTKDLMKIWADMQTRASISYRILPSKINESVSDFKELSLTDQKHFLIEILDKNQLYVNYSEIDDADYKVSDNDKKLNQMFYGGF